MGMETKHPPKPDAPVDRGAGYERRDANIPALLQFAFWLAVLLAVTLVGMKWTFSYFNRTEPLGPPASPLVKPGARVLPPSPRLQVQPHLELKDYCEAQQAVVNSYGWVDRQSGVVRIPVDRAMELVLERGLPARPSGEAPSADASIARVAPTVLGGDDVQGPCGYLAPPTSSQPER
ncbi:MAG TPA: hypothetical protein VNM68_04145 [Candidatus Polarisedimenticolia bacterium]|nr:hypothetical protein [Candidatus Polarisedimenticolia bacterium]